MSHQKRFADIVSEFSDIRLRGCEAQNMLYTCVCCHSCSSYDKLNVFASDHRNVYACRKVCSHTFSQMLAFVQGFILCKVLSVFIDFTDNAEQQPKPEEHWRLTSRCANITERGQKANVVLVGGEESGKCIKTEDVLDRVLDVFAIESPSDNSSHVESLASADLQSFKSENVLKGQAARRTLRCRKKALHSGSRNKKMKSSKPCTSYLQKYNIPDDPDKLTARKRRKSSTGQITSTAKADKVLLGALENGDKTWSWSCSECGKIFATRKTLKAHLKIKHKKDMSHNKICRICSQGFSRQAGLSLHMANKHRGEKAVECESCGERFSSSTDCDRHITLVHGKQRGVCHICGKHFKYMHTLQAHVRAHTGVRAFVCEFCGKGFLRQTTLIDHKKRHFCKDCKQNMALCECPRPEKKRLTVEANGAFQCRFCSTILETLDLFESHVAAHKMDWPYSCSMCDKRFMDKTGLRAHMHQHREKRFQCDICHKTFTYKCNLKHHRENHDVEGRPFPCNVCQKTFKTEMALKVHQRTHLEERRVNCHICGRSLSRVNNLKRHLKVMHPDYVAI